MRSLIFLIIVAALISLGCLPPPPFVAYNPKDAGAAEGLAREEVRVLPLSPDVAFGRITEALLNMKCRLTASDSANGVLSFELTEEIPWHATKFYSVKEGTIHVTRVGDSTKCRLALRGRLVKYPGPHSPVSSILAPEEHSKFLNSLMTAFN